MKHPLRPLLSYFFFLFPDFKDEIIIERPKLPKIKDEINVELPILPKIKDEKKVELPKLSKIKDEQFVELPKYPKIKGPKYLTLINQTYIWKCVVDGARGVEPTVKMGHDRPNIVSEENVAEEIQVYQNWQNHDM